MDKFDKSKVTRSMLAEKMSRSVEDLANNTFDLLVIGGGIYGACIARDAAMRGLSVALVEKNDFGSSTSANSLKIIHGGLRYLQDGNLSMVRLMAKERSSWLRIAPHLVHPLRFMLPTHSDISRNKYLLKMALMLNDLLSYDRNKDLDPQKQLPRGQVLSQSYMLHQLGCAAPKCTGGIAWYDAQIYDSERLLISIILSAVQAGAMVANYVKVCGFSIDSNNIRLVHVEDTIKDNRFDIHADLVFNCTGAWSDQVLGLIENPDVPQSFPTSVAVNLITRKLPFEYALGFRSGSTVNNNGKQQSHTLFITPWQDYSIVGTWHLNFDGQPGDFRVTENMLETFVQELSGSFSSIQLRREDIYRVHFGFLPTDTNSERNGKINLLRKSKIHDHAKTGGVENLVTVIGVKYTTARYTAQKAVDLAESKLGRSAVNCKTDTTPIVGGGMPSFADYLQSRLLMRPYWISEQSLTHLIYSYGTRHSTILKLIEQEPDLAETVSSDSPVLKAEIVHAVRMEMAQTLADVVYRRTPLGAVEPISEESLQTSASLMASELAWDEIRCQQEIIAARNEFARHSWAGTMESKLLC